MRPLLFALKASREYGEAVSHKLEIPLGALEECDFEDGEHKARPAICVRNEDVLVLQSLYADAEATIDDKLNRLLFFIGALRDGSARTITAVIPYLAYSRQDRRTERRDPVTTRYVAALFEAVGTDRVIALDVHDTAAFENAFRCCRAEHLEGTALFVKHFANTLGDRDVTVVSPDAGGVRRAERFRNLLAERLRKPIGFALMEKFHTDGGITGTAFGGEVQNRTAIIFDDMIASGSTVVRAARACHERGAAEVYAAATHGLFVGRAGAVLAQADLRGTVVTDSVATSRLPGIGIDTDVTVLETASLLGDAIERMGTGEWRIPAQRFEPVPTLGYPKE